jgi:hypothetical protein
MGFFRPDSDETDAQVPIGNLDRAECMCPIGTIEAIVVFKYLLRRDELDRFERAIARIMLQHLDSDGFLFRCETVLAKQRQKISDATAKALQAWECGHTEQQPN